MKTNAKTFFKQHLLIILDAFLALVAIQQITLEQDEWAEFLQNRPTGNVRKLKKVCQVITG